MGIVYYSDTCIVYFAVRETEYFTEILRNIPRMREQWCPGRFFPPPQKNGLGTRLGASVRARASAETVWAWSRDSAGPRPPIKYEVPFFQPDPT